MAASSGPPALVWLYGRAARDRGGEGRSTLPPEVIFPALVRSELASIGVVQAGASAHEALRMCEKAADGAIVALALVRCVGPLDVFAQRTPGEDVVRNYWAATRYGAALLLILQCVSVCRLRDPRAARGLTNQSIPHTVFFDVSRFVAESLMQGPCVDGQPVRAHVEAWAADMGWDVSRFFGGDGLVRLSVAMPSSHCLLLAHGVGTSGGSQSPAGASAGLSVCLPPTTSSRGSIWMPCPSGRKSLKLHLRAQTVFY